MLVHFLHRVHGLNSDDVRTSALALDCLGQRVSVLHPLLCLEAKLSNLLDFDQEHPPRQDLKHARICALTMHAYVTERLAAGHVREGLAMIERVMRLGALQSGLVARHAHGLDLQEVIPAGALRSVAVSEPKAANFLDRRWEQLQTILADRRSRFGAVAQHAGSQAHPVHPLFSPRQPRGQQR